ncbi:MAG TPA: hypothetical protein VHX39_29225 [Acetobacteraceae bacterium]|nr:hypothetical protein [Acetobacteraceae bacterium]
MAAAFKEVRKLQGERVRMRFDDGREVVATLLCATKDIDGSRHLIYDKVEAGPAGATGCLYADAKALVKIEPADAKNHPAGPKGRDHVSMRSQFEQEWTKALRPSA